VTGKRALKDLAMPILARSGVPRLFHRCVYSDKLTIITYHGIVRTPLPIYDWCFLDKGIFREQMVYLKRHFDVLPLSRAVDAVKLGKISRPTTVITFDDGYENNWTVAFPILQELQLPAAIFLTTSWIDTGNTLRYLRLNEALANTRESLLLWNGRSLDLRNTQSREHANVLIRQEIRALPQSERMSRLSAIIKQLGDEPDRPIRFVC
jgi:hypothetical protein